MRIANLKPTVNRFGDEMLLSNFVKHGSGSVKHGSAVFNRICILLNTCLTELFNIII